MPDQIAQYCLSYFLCNFDPKSKKRRTQDVVSEVACRWYSVERVNEFLDHGLSAFQQALVEEFNARYQTGSPLRFQIADPAGVGAWVEGFRHSPHQRKEVAFQDALHKVNAKDFEKLAAIILKYVGCEEVFFTPTSHDQGVDAFGYRAASV